MKIRSYRGRSLETLYGAIRREMGPDAVVVPMSPQRRSFLPFVGGPRHELIAVVDDATASPCAADVANGSLAALLEQGHEKLEARLREVQRELAVLGRVRAPRPDHGAPDLPDFARNWDACWLRALRKEAPDFFAWRDRETQRRIVGDRINVEESFPVRKPSGPHIVVMTGPTGSGKTTTVAKLASRWSLNERLNVGLITTDTYRVGATDQIREYAALLGLDLRIAFSAQAAGEAAQSLSGKDVILVDTPGRSHLDPAGLKAIQGVLRAMGPMSVFLVLPAPLHPGCAADILMNFGVLNPDYLVLSKVDETRSFDVITTIASATNRPFAFITDGQRVPRDIQAAQRDVLASLLIPPAGASLSAARDRSAAPDVSPEDGEP